MTATNNAGDIYAGSGDSQDPAFDIDFIFRVGQSGEDYYQYWKGRR